MKKYRTRLQILADRLQIQKDKAIEARDKEHWTWYTPEQWKDVEDFVLSLKPKRVLGQGRRIKVAWCEKLHDGPPPLRQPPEQLLEILLGRLTLATDGAFVEIPRGLKQQDAADLARKHGLTVARSLDNPRYLIRRR